jgi:hypothetical protein
VGLAKTSDLLDVIGLDPFEAIDKHEGKYGMEFFGRSDVPGVIAGQIGKDVGSYGAHPSLRQDYRRAKGWAFMSRRDRASLSFEPYISYRVEDTVDLCPGNPGDRKAQILTVPFSQYEATGISGDVPYYVDFPAPDIAPSTVIVPGMESSEREKKLPAPTAPPSMARIKALFYGNSPYPGPVKGPGNPGNSGVNPLGAFNAAETAASAKAMGGASRGSAGAVADFARALAGAKTPFAPGRSLGWSEEEVARRAVALAAAPAAKAGRREGGAAPAPAGSSRKVTFYQTVDNVTIHTGGPLDAQALRAALERFMRSEATAVA